MTPSRSPQWSESMPTDIRGALSAQMCDVLDIQEARAAACRAAAERVIAARAGHDGDQAGSPGTERDAGAPTEIVAARAEYRAERKYWNEGGPTMARTDATHLRIGDVDVPLRIHRPTTEAILPGIVFLHGGGFILGDLDTHDRIARVIAATSGAAVIAVDYSLSPEAVFPQALLECATVIDHLADHGEDWGVDGTRLAVAGDSAGAMLALGSALLLRDEPERVGAESSFGALRALLLVYGSHGLRDSASRRLYGGTWDGMGPEVLAGIANVHYTSPADAESRYVDHLGADLRGLPPTFIAAAGLDPLRDDSRGLAALLQRAGTDVDVIEYPHVLHSFLHFGRVLDEANAALTAAAEFAAARLDEEN